MKKTNTCSVFQVEVRLRTNTYKLINQCDILGLEDLGVYINCTLLVNEKYKNFDGFVFRLLNIAMNLCKTKQSLVRTESLTHKQEIMLRCLRCMCGLIDWLEL